MRKKVGITGQSGFIGTHLINNLLITEGIEIIPFQDAFFENISDLDEFVSQCDTIVHLAAMNRHNDPDIIYQTNVSLVEKLIKSVSRCGTKPHIIMSSSTQESRDNPYGCSKKEGRAKFIEFSNINGCFFTGIIIPNVYGPFGNPFYNSVTATFSYLIANNLDVEIQVDTELEMIYVQDLVVSIISVILEEKYSEELHLSSTGRISVSELKNLLITFHQIYGNGIIPRMEDRFEISLFNTYRSYLPQDFFPVLLTKHSDNRGVFVEVIRSFGEGQYSFSTTNPGITRGNHYHIRKIERFAVISGRASIKIRQIGTQEVREYIIEGENPGYVDIPIWHTHCITNIGDSELITLFWINEFYNPSDPDTFFESV